MGDAGPPGSVSHVDLLRQATVGLEFRVAAILLRSRLTLDEWRVLRALAEGGPLSMSELAGQARISGPTLTRIVDRLVERALLYRNVDATDRRRVLVHAAERGRRMHRSLAPRIDEAEHTGLSALSDAEAATLRRLLERLAGQ